MNSNCMCIPQCPSLRVLCIYPLVPNPLLHSAPVPHMPPINESSGPRSQEKDWGCCPAGSPRVGPGPESTSSLSARKRSCRCYISRTGCKDEGFVGGRCGTTCVVKGESQILVLFGLSSSTAVPIIRASLKSAPTGFRKG